MAHMVPIHTREQFVEAIRVLDEVGGPWHGVGSSSDRRLLLTDAQFDALVEAGVVPSNDKEVKNGKKRKAKKTKS